MFVYQGKEYSLIAEQLCNSKKLAHVWTKMQQNSLSYLGYKSAMKITVYQSFAMLRAALPFVGENRNENIYTFQN